MQHLRRTLRSAGNSGSPSISLPDNANGLQSEHQSRINLTVTDTSPLVRASLTSSLNDEDAPSTSGAALEDCISEAGSDTKKPNRDESDHSIFSMRNTSDSEEHLLSTESFVGTTAEKRADLRRKEGKASRASVASSIWEATSKRKQNVGGEETRYTTPGSVFSESGRIGNLDCEPPYTDGRARVYLRRGASNVFPLEHRASFSCPQLPSKQLSKRQKGESRGTPRFSSGISVKEVTEPKRKSIKKKSLLPHSYVKEQRAYFAEVDAFELQEEEVAEEERGKSLTDKPRT
ncbi:hypothetical protein O6H91_13G006700 [Diphasiastrum complanatum]|uniref:Uncharacterized protein n=1 Tax=Diphasiastrum complanatum TaxID=34168 RepID=A0ACC2BSU7_DIPCM|nr:hypothetical protein O6H91_13G006700 [Diphasiastrum complanatum]